MRNFGIVVVTVAAMTSSGCFSALFGRRDEKSDIYVLTTPTRGWDVVDPGGADRAYRNRDDQAILSISSLCSDDRYRPLEDLSADLIKQLPERQIVNAAQPIGVDGHPGLVTEVRGMVDGRELAVRVAVFRTSTCVYDILLAGPELKASSREAFDLILQDFHERSRP